MVLYLDWDSATLDVQEIRSPELILIKRDTAWFYQNQLGAWFSVHSLIRQGPKDWRC
jgi:hypothetical protein